MTVEQTKIDVAARELFRVAIANNRAFADRLFAGLMLFQWGLVVVLALVVSPRAWAGSESQTHIHLWLAIIMGGLCTLPTVYFARVCPGKTSNGFVVAIAQMVMGMLVMHLTGGRIESHFHVFASIGMLAVYRDWRVLLLGLAVTAVDHVARGFYWWESAYGQSTFSNWLWLEHAAWAIFPVPVLGWMCVLGTREMSIQANRQAALSEAETQSAANLAVLAAQADEIRVRTEREAVARAERDAEAARAHEEKSQRDAADRARQLELQQREKVAEDEKRAAKELLHQAEVEKAADIQKRVSMILTTVHSLAEGDFTREVPPLGNDALGKVGIALNTAITSVRAALEGVREVSEQLADASGQLASASEEISTGAQEQASSLEETASTLEEITSTVKRNSDSSQQARQLASSSRDVAEKGGQVVSSAVEAMEAINQSSKKIADIITAIDEIAFQTNLLALNAAVEAARAGEQGRGFAVVASEVRNLAQRSATAAKEIKNLIQDSVKKVDAGTELVNRSGATLGEIVTSVKRVTDIITEIAAASKEQTTGIEQVNIAVSQMDTVTQRNASQTEEMSATAQTLTEQAGQLRDLVQGFKLGGEAVAKTAPKMGRARTAGAAKPKPRVGPVAKTKGSKNGQHANHELDRLGDDGFTEF